MTKLNSKSPFPEFVKIAKKLQLEICDAPVGYELWYMDLYRGGFPTISLLADELNQRYEMHLDEQAENEERLNRLLDAKAAEKQKSREPFRTAMNMLTSAKEAAVLLYGKPVGLCKTLEGRGGSIMVAYCDNGVPRNIRNLSVSFSKKNISAAASTGSDYSAFEYNGDLYYVSNDPD